MPQYFRQGILQKYSARVFCKSILQKYSAKVFCKNALPSGYTEAEL